ncbi:MAG: hypothetical protein KJ621_10545 [Proteobacteria bacterium]|nr:hypothetical protein [Pseudomonadota bacterium]MBU1742293.1 hypothetical protein [Pseudomonadota bacterium]
MSVSELNERLAVAFGFSSGDAYENQAGRLTPRQKGLLAGYQRTRRLGFSFIGLIVLVLAGMWVVVSFFHEALGWRDLSEASLFISIVLGGLAALLAICMLVGVAKGSDLRRGRISVVEGVAEVEVEEFERPKVPDEFFEVHSVKVQDKKFTVEPGQAAAFESGARYRIFYVKYSPPILLSAEAI